MNDEEREFGPQPLIAIMEKWALESHDLVEASPAQLTHKQVQRARSGRRLTLKMMMKVAQALNLAIWNRLKKEERPMFVEYLHKDTFSYSKGYDSGKQDPNLKLSALHESDVPAEGPVSPCDTDPASRGSMD